MSFTDNSLIPFSIGPTRSFAGISGYVTLGEGTVDAMEITKQPVQQGANISDHAFVKPVILSMQILFADNLTQSLAQMYQKLLALQRPTAAAQPTLAPGVLGPLPPTPLPQLLPFNVVTPKRTYFNMLLATLGMTTDKKTENCLAITATFEQVILVPVTVTSVPRSQLKNPGSNGATQKVGQVSALKTSAGFVGL